MPKFTDGPFLWHEAWERQDRPGFTRLQNFYLLCTCSIPAPFLLPVSGSCSLTPMDKWDGKKNGSTEETRSSPVHNRRIKLGVLEESWGVDTSSKSQSWGATYSKTHVYLHPDNATPSNAFSGWGLYNLELEVAEDLIWQENSHRGSRAGRWGLELFLNLNSVELHQFFREESSF